MIIVMLVAQYDWILFAMPFLELKPQSYLCKFGEYEEPPSTSTDLLISPASLTSWFKCSEE